MESNNELYKKHLENYYEQNPGTIEESEYSNSEISRTEQSVTEYTDGQSDFTRKFDEGASESNIEEAKIEVPDCPPEEGPEEENIPEILKDGEYNPKIVDEEDGLID